VAERGAVELTASGDNTHVADRAAAIAMLDNVAETNDVADTVDRIEGADEVEVGRDFENKRGRSPSSKCPELTT
jgi:hypothetical protein